MTKSEPPSRRHQSSLFLIGRNSRGHWVVRDPSGMRGGLFVDRTEALRFALFENGHRPQAVIMVPDVLELDLATGPIPAQPAGVEPGGRLRAA